MHTEHFDDCPLCRRAADLDDDGTPVGSKEHELFAAEDWPALVQVRERQLARHPLDPHVRLALAEALLLAGDPERALELAARCHEVEPGDPAIEDAILEALFALGRSESDFPWRGGTPPVHRLGEALLAQVHERLREEDEPKEVGLLFYELCDGAFARFDLGELLDALRADPRFATERDDSPWEATVRAVVPSGAG